MSVKTQALIAAGSLAALVLSGTARSASLALDCTEYQNSNVPANCPTTATPEMLSTPGTYVYTDTSLLPDTSSGGIIPGSAYPTGYSGASFYDAFVFQVGNSQGDSISTTINLGSLVQITNFEERLYAYTGTAPTIGPVSGAMDAWTIPAGSLGTVAVLPSTFLPAGTYVLEIRGDVTGSLTGLYAGALQLSPVPLPSTTWLLVSGLFGLYGLALPGVRSRRNAFLLS